MESMNKPLLHAADEVDPIDLKDTEHRAIGTGTGAGAGTRNGHAMGAGRDHSERTMAHPVAIKLLCEYHLSDVEGWLRAWAEQGSIPSGLKKAARKIKLSKASVTEWLNMVDVEEQTPRSASEHTAPLLPRASSNKHRGDDGGEGGGSIGGAEGGGGDGGVDGADREEEEVVVAEQEGEEEEEKEDEDYAWRTSVMFENLYEEVRDMYLAPRRWPGKGKVRWIQGYGSGYFLTVRYLLPSPCSRPHPCPYPRPRPRPRPPPCITKPSDRSTSANLHP